MKDSFWEIATRFIIFFTFFILIASIICPFVYKRLKKWQKSRHFSMSLPEVPSSKKRRRTKTFKVGTTDNVVLKVKVRANIDISQPILNFKGKEHFSGITGVNIGNTNFEAVTGQKHKGDIIDLTFSIIAQKPVVGFIVFEVTDTAGRLSKCQHPIEFINN
ncbi:hypothetical protein ACFLUU_02000 [Chloroflexota bacterium]